MGTATAVSIPAGGVRLPADLIVVPDAAGVVLFAHGSGSARYSPRNQLVAERLRAVGLSTVLVDLLTRPEELAGIPLFDIGLLGRRLVAIVDWLARQPETGGVPLGMFGASTGAAAALLAATDRPDAVQAIVSRGGRPDLADAALAQVKAATLLIVGERDPVVRGLNQKAATDLAGPWELRVVPHATHLFAEPGAVDQVATWAADWFGRYLG